MNECFSKQLKKILIESSEPVVDPSDFSMVEILTVLVVVVAVSVLVEVVVVVVTVVVVIVVVVVGSSPKTTSKIDI